MDVKEYDHVVVYTDGSRVGPPNGTGGGIHGYAFNSGVLNENTPYSLPDVEECVTTNGYKKFPKDIKKPTVPETVDFFDCVIPVPAEFWSDVAELMAFISLFENSPILAKNYTIYIDASYVVNAWNDWMDGWRKRGWTKADGTPIANVNLIKKMDEIKARLRQEGRSIRVIKIKGHAGFYGNERADMMARKASSMVAAGQGVEYRPLWSVSGELPAEPEAEVMGTDGSLLNMPKITNTKFCYPLVNEEHPTMTINGESWKYMFGGNHAKNKEDIVFIGKMIPDAQFAVFLSKEGWENVYQLVNKHNELAWDNVPPMKRYDPIAIVYNTMIKRKKFQDAAKEGLPVNLMKFSEDGNLWLYEDLAITRVVRPALLSYRALEIRDELAAFLRDGVEDRPSVVLNDITHLLFDEKDKPVKTFYRNVDVSFNVKVNYPESDKQIPIILTRNIDMPDRTDMNRIMEPGGKWYVACRRPQKRCVEFAVVYIGKEYHGLWCGYYANKRILKEEEV